jgi:MoaA/NifB/PqqE/SkfB family radical SAM enzyme
MRITELLQLGYFFGSLAVKEHLLPNLPVRPLVAEIFLTENCNLRCVSCACWRDTTRDELSTAEWQQVLQQLAALRIYKVNFTGGEPLIRADAIDLMRYARQAGIRHMHLNSNALLLTPDRLERILGAGVRSFNISVDGTREVHDRVRGRAGAFERTITHLKHLLAQRERFDLKVRMNFTVMRSNVSVLPSIAALAQDLGVQLYLNLATDHTFLFRDAEVGSQTQVAADDLRAALAEVERLARRDRRWLPRYSDLRYVGRHFSELVQSDVPCAESQLKLMIHSQGQIGGCWGHDPTANVRQSSIASVIKSPQYQQEHARLFRKECVGCGSNYSLNLRWRPRTYVEDLLWRLGRHQLTAA